MKNPKFSATRAALLAVLLLILFSAAYVELLESIVDQDGLSLSPGWVDNTFDMTAWQIISPAPTNASLSSANGVLMTSVSGNLSAHTNLYAERIISPAVNISQFKFLRLLIQTSSVNIATAATVRLNSTYAITILLKTYNDRNWHTEVIDLSFFALHGTIYAVELGLTTIKAYNGTASVSYQQLSFNRMVP